MALQAKSDIDQIIIEMAKIKISIDSNPDKNFRVEEEKFNKKLVDLITAIQGKLNHSIEELTKPDPDIIGLS